MMKIFSALILMTLLSSCTMSQNEVAFQLVGGPCEGCEAIFEYGDKPLNTVDTLPDFNEPGLQIKVQGIVYKNDGKTPAEDVVLYVYHTDQNGLYTPKGNGEGWANNHGYIRGWVKTDDNGQYTFYTLKPAPYPNGAEPAHIHPIILEPNGKYYWLSSFFFQGDPLLSNQDVNPDASRGGVGLLSLKKEGELWVGTRNIILGKNISGYNNANR